MADFFLTNIWIVRDYFLHLKDYILVEILFLIAVIWASGKLFRKFKLPDVVGQLVGGIIIGPPLLGLIILTPSMELLAELGSFFIMFFVGLETDLKSIGRNFKRSFTMASLGVLFPFVIGFIVANMYFHNNFAAFHIALTMAATAIAVTERLLSHLPKIPAKYKSTIIGAAAITDLILVLLFSGFMSYAQLETASMIPFLINLLKMGSFIGLVSYVGFILYPKYAPKMLTPGADGFTFILLVAFVIGTLSEMFGLHFVFGGFMAGLFAHDELAGKEIYAQATDRMYAIAHGFLGPIFFLSIASHVVLKQIPEVLPFLIIAIILAFTLKTAGVTAGALLTKASWSQSLFYGFGMNGRGSVSLIMANVAYKASLITEQVFSVIIIIAITCALITPFLLQRSAQSLYDS
jgi:Kef-type K+ transport system membrane component KefB